MQQVTVDAARWLRDGDGSWLAFRVGSDKTAMDVCDSLKAGKEYNLTLKRKGRSLDANAYFWVLVNRLADKLKIEPEASTGPISRISAAAMRWCRCGRIALTHGKRSGAAAILAG